MDLSNGFNEEGKPRLAFYDRGPGPAGKVTHVIHLISRTGRSFLQCLGVLVFTIKI